MSDQITSIATTTQQAATWATKRCRSMTFEQLERAYGRNSILGLGEVCDVYLNEMDRRMKHGVTERAA